MSNMSGILGGTTNKLGRAIPGGWGGETPSQEKGNPSEEQEIQESGGNLVAGIVGQTGEIVDETGKTVGKITEGDGQGLIGNVVTATGDIVGKDGGILGKAVPLGDNKAEGGGFSLMGVGKGVKGVVDTVDGTVQTVSSSLPILGNITKGIGLGGGKADDGSTPKLGDTLGGLLGAKPEDRDADEKSQATDDAKRELFEFNDKTQEVAPISLEDKEGHTVVDSRSQPPQSDAGEESESKGEATEQSLESGVNLAGNVGEEATENVPDADKTKDDAHENIDDAKDNVEETAEDAKSKVGDAPVEAQDAAQDVGDDVKSKAEDVPEGAEEAADEAKSKAEDLPEGAEEAADEAGSKADEATPSQLDEIETVQIPGNVIKAPFEQFEGAEIDDEGKVIFENESIGKVVEGNPEDMAHHEIGPDGAILNESGSEIGRVELKSEIAHDLEEQYAQDLEMIKGCKVNKGGNLVNDKNQVVGRITSGIISHMIGRKADEKGQIWNDSGVIIGQAELIPEHERQEFKEPAPFEDFPEAVVQSNGEVTYNGDIVGRLIEGDGKALKGKYVDEDGDIQDRQGNVIGKAERWEPEPEPEPEPEAEIDKSILAGKRINKGGYAVDSNGNIFGKVSEGTDVKRVQGRMCNKNGEIVSESGDVIGTVDLVPEGEREGMKEGPFAELPQCTVRRDGMVVTPSDEIVGRLVEGDGKVLFGRVVDEDGDVLDRNGNSIGKAERWEPEEEPEKAKGPMEGRRVNKKGEVYDDDQNLMGKLTSGDLTICSGKEIDSDGDVVDSKGHTIGHVTLLDDIPEEGETEEAKKQREEAERDEKLAKDLGGCIEQGLDKIRPICKMITEKVERAERTPKDELDEEELVKQVKPLIEEGGKILNELNGTIRALDPDGRIQRNAKHKSGTRDATPAEYHLADVLKELTGTVTTCIDNAKKMIEDMPHAKKELNPLWGLLTEPLGQILAAVGLLLTGVLNLVGRLLNGLGLGGIVDGLLGTLGLNRILDSLGVGSLTGALTGRDERKKKGGKSGGLLGGVLG